MKTVALLSTLALAIGVTTPATAAAPAKPAAAAAPVALKGDAAKGAKLFVQCSTCHVTIAGVNRMGPSLSGIVGRKAGIGPNYTYSPAMKASGITWTEPKLAEFIEAPRTVVPGTKMYFAGIKAPQDRADIIAYLKGQ